MIVALFRWQDAGAVDLVIGSVLYLVGALLVTLVFNVPKNKALGSVTPAEGTDLWAEYLSKRAIFGLFRKLLI